MPYKIVKKQFKLVGLKGNGEYGNFGKEVPFLAKQFLNRANEVPNSTGTEIALFEPKKDEQHRIGQYFVGFIVNDEVNEVPAGMDYIETNKNYITTRGNISNVGSLHSNLLIWAEEQGYQRDLDAYIVETYHPIGEGGEEVEIYLPIKEIVAH
ncbi:hypothetical protein A8F94_00625 [Bacillus sp. FJAT-27225]|uniref:GyrI-like domain-containing protein n=1 Tax=Bacillus sp. FJAT-27225 TaxID=1743144 RepID=UPI00080C32FE|nr:GyrI-like domain-containing protein [Bacillus sp. FJAT-27225]OCA90430.1 hypothetical protein A8F94_00625 [Bacillus sp. FJAT-27225]